MEATSASFIFLVTSHIKTLLTEFTLLGLSGDTKLERFILSFFALIYVITLLGNLLILCLIHLDPHLHIPMYYFLRRLALIDICYPSSTFLPLFLNYPAQRRIISLTGCAIQMYTFLVLATTECILLAVMAYDRYVAICLPLHYMMTMSNRKCVTLTLLSWVSGLVLPITHTVLAWKLPYCGPSVIDHFFCELPAVLQLACADTYLIKLVTQVGCLFTLLMPTAFIVFSYMNILVAILKTDSAKKREKAFSTCLSHLMVVVLFYGSVIYMYMKPNSLSQKDKIISTLYSILTPMLNPTIYSLRNMEVKKALVRLIRSNGLK
ncbi:olfactory receptor 2a12-like [Limosa lapponica baueri]|uniref:Olfactory receptor n=1 Tax=Limosa lapponica baueri TaxID=1758121 RepID=A0A2I0TKU2_LIMLA|nr:olfactory receptor 2a12-like [Limosa lapponica baueri]